MGSGRDKRKKAKGGNAGQGAEKTARKTELNEAKATRRAVKQAEEGEDNLDAILAQFALDEKARTRTVFRERAEPPSPRLFASITAISNQEFLLIGGEWYDGKLDKMRVFGDVYRYHTGKQEWTQILIPSGPQPRSAHQAVLHKGHVYTWGGELTSPNQEKFRHYKDLWRLDLESYSWEQMNAKGGPNARSGHRMAVHKDRLVLFGGFNDTGKSPTYYGDVWLYDIPAMTWSSIKAAPGMGPSPRGGSQIAIHNDTLFVIWGHSVMMDPADRTELEKVHGDVWGLDLTTSQWERVKKEGLAPSPARASFGMAVHNDAGFVFGGVHDQKGRKDAIYSELYNDLYQFGFKGRRWYPVQMRLKPAAAKDSQPAGGTADDKLTSALQKAATRIQAHYRGYAVRKAFKTYKLGGKLSELLYTPAAVHGVDLKAATVKPRARANPMLTVCHNTLYLYGGVVEVAHTDITLDDLWALDLAKLDGWQCLQPNTAGDDVFEEDPDWATDSGSDAA